MRRDTVSAFLNFAHGEPLIAIGVTDKDVESTRFCALNFFEGVSDESGFFELIDDEFERGEVIKGARAVIRGTIDFFVNDLEVCGADVAHDHRFEGTREDEASGVISAAPNGDEIKYAIEEFFRHEAFAFVEHDSERIVSECSNCFVDASTEGYGKDISVKDFGVFAKDESVDVFASGFRD